MYLLRNVIIKVLMKANKTEGVKIQ